MNSNLFSYLRAHPWKPQFMLFLLAWPVVVLGQEPSATPFEETIKPTFETQKQARTYLLDIPAPRGQITDRNGNPLAQNKLSYNLAINFPTPLDFSDARALEYAQERIRVAEKRLDRSLAVSDSAILRHYHNRGFLPFEIAQNLSDEEQSELKGNLPPGLSLKPIYMRIYPNKSVAGQVIGYTGRTSRNADGIIQNGQVLWPETEGREGLEQTFNSMLTGRHGKFKVTFDRDGRQTSERIVEPPVPGYNVVT
ncbi:MAG: hypothetical protein ABIU29_00255, partial [Chthoniobacterales bacterium]